MTYSRNSKMNSDQNLNQDDDLRDVVENAEIRETENLTQYLDDSAKRMVGRRPPNLSQIFSMTDTLPDQGTTKLASRSYELTTLVWTSADTKGSTIYNPTFPTTLMSLPWLAEMATRFSYFRCKGIELTFRANSTPFHFGALAVSHVVGKGTIHNANWRQRLNNSPHILNVMEAPVIKLEIPWELPYAWLDLPLAGSQLTEMANVHVDVLSQLYQDADSTQDVDVSVFGKFIDPEFQGPIAAEAAPPVFIPKTGSRRRPRAPKSVKGESGVVQHPGKTEADKKVEQSSEVGPSGGNGLQEMIQTFKVGAEFVKELAPLIAMMDKPTNAAPLTLVESMPGRPMPSIDGMSDAVVLGTSQKTGLAVEGKLVDGYPVPLTVSQFAQKPSYMMSYALSAGNNPNTKVMEWTVTPCRLLTADGTDKNYGYAAWAANLFKFWRGTMKYQLFVFTSRFTSVRLRIIWFPTLKGLTACPASISDNETGDYLRDRKSVV